MVKSADSEISLPYFESQFRPSSSEALRKSLVESSQSQFPSVATCKELTTVSGKLYSALTIIIV